MVDDKVDVKEVKEPLCIFEGYLQKAVKAAKEDIKVGGPMLMWSLQMIEKYRGQDKIPQVIEEYKLEQFGIRLNKKPV